MILDNLNSKMVTSTQDMINQIDDDFIMPSLEDKKELFGSLNNAAKETQESDLKDLNNNFQNKEIKDKKSLDKLESKNISNLDELSNKINVQNSNENKENKNINEVKENILEEKGGINSVSSEAEVDKEKNQKIISM